MDPFTLDVEIARRTAELDALKAQKTAADTDFGKLTEAQRLATVLHGLFTAGGDTWDGETWEAPGPARTLWASRAADVLAVASAKKVAAASAIEIVAAVAGFRS